MSGHGCPNCQKIKARSTTEEYIKKVYIISKDITVIGKYIGSANKIKHECKRCGNLWYARPSQILQGCGCPKCNKSKGERTICRLFDKNNILYSEEYQQTWSNKKRYDFKVKNILIEFDGDQHFREVNYFNVDLSETKSIDIYKTKNAINHGYKLIRLYSTTNETMELMLYIINNIEHYGKLILIGNRYKNLGYINEFNDINWL